MRGGREGIVDSSSTGELDVRTKLLIQCYILQSAKKLGAPENSRTAAKTKTKTRTRTRTRTQTQTLALQTPFPF